MGAGHPRNFETPEILLSVWDDYKKEVDSDLEVEVVVTGKGDLVERKIKKPYLRSGFEAYCFRVYRCLVAQYIDNNAGLYEEYIGVVTCMRKEWETDQVTGTMTGRYKSPNLTARLNGIKDATDVTTNGKDVNAGIIVQSKEDKDNIEKIG